MSPRVEILTDSMTVSGRASEKYFLIVCRRSAVSVMFCILDDVSWTTSLISPIVVCLKYKPRNVRQWRGGGAFVLTAPASTFASGEACSLPANLRMPHC